MRRGACRLERFPFTWNCVIEKESLRFNALELGTCSNDSFLDWRETKYHA
ncbi:MAG: hypothetical protein USCAAHI_00892 [Beijerinckiaceae bacterium]|nr:MAG: hypothetical protein USCAAHI_00892 [Beijerinckiaceae bacterium]